MTGSGSATAISSILGLVAAGTRLGAGALLMLIGAIGVAASTAAYPLLLPLAPPLAPPKLATYPRAGYYVVSLAPTLALLIAAALAFVSSAGRGANLAPLRVPYGASAATRPLAKLAQELAPKRSTPEGTSR